MVAMATTAPNQKHEPGVSSTSLMQVQETSSAAFSGHYQGAASLAEQLSSNQLLLEMLALETAALLSMSQRKTFFVFMFGGICL